MLATALLASGAFLAADLPPHPEGYVCPRAKSAPAIDGKLEDPAWADAPWTADFVDIEGDRKPRPRFRTRAKMLWDDQFFYIAAELEEPHVWGTLTQHDAVIFQDNDFEVFIDPDGDNHEYYEFEINALNTGWDLFLPKPYRDGGPAKNEWEIPGLETAVHIEGTLNKPDDVDRAWSLELAIPWKVLDEFAHRNAPPKDGDRWRVNFSRVEWEHAVEGGKYAKVKGKREDNWVWSPQGVVDMHRPELWGYVEFAGAPRAKFAPDPAHEARHLLMLVYHAQAAYKKQHGAYAAGLEALKLGDLAGAGAVLEAEDGGYRATLGGWEIRQDSRLVPVPRVK